MIQGKKSAVLFWPAAHNMFYGIRPLIYSWVYSDNISLREKIDNVIAYFRENVVDLVMLYHLYVNIDVDYLKSNFFSLL